VSIAARLADVRERIDVAARAHRRSGDDVTLVVVTKEVGLEAIREALAAGARDLGENRAQDLAPKAEALHGDPWLPRWHFIGRLQRNKVRAVASHVALWQSVDREDLAVEIGKRAPGASVLVQVNAAAEPQKGGCAPEAVGALVECAQQHGCNVVGLMTVPPAEDDPRPWFARHRALTEKMGLPVCSMGMSSDYEVAIAEGSTMVRVGTAIFGPRPRP
jgi:pyridoxal phosphate enzyme (YggS family)